jgi:hypothetical protein
MTSRAVLVRPGCAGFVRGARSGRNVMCGRCGKNRTIHRRWLALDGGKNEEGTMSAHAIEAVEAISSERKASVVDAMKVLLLADPGAAIHVQVTDADRWEQVKATIRPLTMRLVNMGGLRVAEAFICRVGDIVYNLSGPAFYASREQHEQMLDDRAELEPFATEEG